MFFEDHIDDAKYCGHLYGLGASFVQNGTNNSSSNSTNNYDNSHASGTVTNGDAASSSATIS
jgi:hypothetical protein